MILGPDVASLVTGYAFVSDERPARLMDCGTLRMQGDDPMQRIDTLICDVTGLIADCPHALSTVAVEVTTGKVSKRHGGGGAGLAVYGMAVGAVYAWLRCMSVSVPNRYSYEVMAVRENVWTKGVPKHKRMKALAAEFPPYREALDSGKDNKGDIGDAIGVALYAQAELIRREALGHERHPH